MILITKKSVLFFTLYAIFINVNIFAQNCQGPSNCPPGDDCGVNTYYRDADGDGKGNPSISIECINNPSGYVLNNQDCDDSNSNVWNTCCTKRTWYRDADNDGIGNSSLTTKSCTKPAGYASTGGDCNDSNASIGRAQTWYIDNDGDGQGADMSSNYHQGLPSSELGQVTVISCSPPSGYVANNLDCNDLNTNTQQTTWGRDLDGDGFGNSNDTYVGCNVTSGYVSNTSDCDDSNSEIRPTTKWYKDNDNDGYSDGTQITRCTRPNGYKLASELQSLNGDCDDTDGSANVSLIWYRDADNDTFGTVSNTKSNCRQPSGYVSNNIDCDDSNPEINPNLVWYEDADKDGFGATNGLTRQSCTDPSVPNDTEWVANNFDCDDSDGLPPPTWYLDIDEDGYGGNSWVQQCERPSNSYSQSLDCDDTNPNVYTAQWWYIDNDGDGLGADITSTRNQNLPSSEFPNPVFDCNPPDSHWVNNNDDCYDPPSGTNGNGQSLLTLYQDNDGDGYGNPEVVLYACDPIDNFITVGEDCNDDPSAGGHLVNPQTLWYQDIDSDGFTSGISHKGCKRPDETFYLESELAHDISIVDCDDEKSTISPQTDWYRDQDQDGFGDPSDKLVQCKEPFGYVLDNSDQCPYHWGSNQGCPTINSNIVQTITAKVAAVNIQISDQYTKGEISISSSHYDGLGNKSQVIKREGSPKGYDLIVPIEYDLKGLIAKEYLPYVASTTNGKYQENAIAKEYSNSDQYDFYQTADAISKDTSPFSEVEYDGSPLNRIKTKYSPGQTWKDSDKNITYSYETNETAEVYQWLLQDGIPTIHPANQHYLSGELSKTVITDESGYKTITFKDKLQQTILKRSEAPDEDGNPNTTEWGDTYYIYDDFGNLRFVLPPQAIKEINHYLD